jgi:hypothetical protein
VAFGHPPHDELRVDGAGEASEGADGATVCAELPQAARLDDLRRNRQPLRPLDEWAVLEEGHRRLDSRRRAMCEQLLQHHLGASPLHPERHHDQYAQR